MLRNLGKPLSLLEEIIRAKGVVIRDTFHNSTGGMPYPHRGTLVTRRGKSRYIPR